MAETISLLSRNRILPVFHSTSPFFFSRCFLVFAQLVSLIKITRYEYSEGRERKGAKGGFQRGKRGSATTMVRKRRRRRETALAEVTSATAQESAKLCGTLLVTGERNESLRERIITLINYFARHSSE